jgi:hypothetical protein
MTKDKDMEGEKKQLAYVLLEETKAQWRSALGHVCARI